jgi:23S rRNA (guanine745-N1)-methyltransferase
MLTCPLCKEELIRVGNAFRCGRGHSYDIAREGYVNLLLANQKASASPGDTKEMAASRRAFLSKGYYAPLSDGINFLIGEDIRKSVTLGARILDAGCGEGYYLHRLMQALPHGRNGYGLDISKEAIRLAAKYKGACFLVASIHQPLPFASASLDVVLNVFAPRSPSEFARVLRPGGMLLVVVPAEGHLAALHDALRLPRIDGGKERRAIEDLGGAFAPSHSETLRYRRVLPPEDVVHLIQMTPTFWHLSDEAQAGMDDLPGLDIEFAFTFTVLRRAPAAQAGCFLPSTVV